MDLHSLEGSSTMPKKKKVNVPKLAVVEWLDAFDGPTGWVGADEYCPHPVRPVSIGWVIENMLEDHISLVGTYLIDVNEDTKDKKVAAVYYSNPAHIPLGMVQSITYIDLPDNVVKIISKIASIRGFNAD